MTLEEALQSMVDALEPVRREIPELQVTGTFNGNPTPPSIDIWPADPFQVGAAFGVQEKLVAWNVRARVQTGDGEAASRLLLQLLDTSLPTSVEAALATADAVVGNDGTVSGFVRFTDDPVGDLLSVTWRVEMFV